MFLDHEASPARIDEMRSIINQNPALDQLLTDYATAQIHAQLFAGNHEFGMNSIEDVKNDLADAMCRRIHYAETEMEVHYSDEQLVNKMKADIQRDLKSLQEQNLQDLRSR